MSGRDYFGAPFFSPRELLLLRYEQARLWLWDRWLRFRLRDRIRFGNNVRIARGGIAHQGLGTVTLEDGFTVDPGRYRVSFNLAPGSHVRIRKDTWFRMNDDNIVFSCGPKAEIEIGERCWFSGGIFGATNRITVGERAYIGWGCTILDSNMHRLDNDGPPPKSAPIEIGAHVWMPSHVTVLPGARIGDHCVIGTGSLVTSEIPSHSFAAGRPAKVIKTIGDRDRVE
jgi:acetyltransferase-like isoleucine patch superfamily enzyme